MLVNVPPASTFCLAVWKVDRDQLDTDGSYSLWLAPGVTGIDGEPLAELPQVTRLTGAAPNPFNPSTTIGFELERAGRCRLAVYDLQGRLVRVLLDEQRSAGTGSVTWDGLDGSGSRMSSGLYLVRLEGGGKTDLLKLTLVK
jgi:hypothetical protein